MYNHFRVKGVHRRNRLTFIPELSVRAVLDNEEIVPAGKLDKHLSFLQIKRLTRRILEIGNHIEKLDFLSFQNCSLDYGFKSLAVGRQVVCMGDATDVRPVGAERLQGTQIGRI